MLLYVKGGNYLLSYRYKEVPTISLLLEASHLKSSMNFLFLWVKILCIYCVYYCCSCYQAADSCCWGEKHLIVWALWKSICQRETKRFEWAMNLWSLQSTPTPFVSHCPFHWSPSRLNQTPFNGRTLDGAVHRSMLSHPANAIWVLHTVNRPSTKTAPGHAANGAEAWMTCSHLIGKLSRRIVTVWCNLG